jgi:hypothetical protein
MNESPMPNRSMTSLTFRCCTCANRTGVAEAYIQDNGDMCCSRCFEANEIDELHMLVLVES